MNPKRKEKDIKWIANIFQFFFFEWIQNPFDVDFDENTSLLDAYKYATSKTNDYLIMMKSNLSKNFNEWCLSKMIYLKQLDLIESSLYKNKQRNQQLNNLLYIYHSQQDPWINNVDLAKKIRF